MFCLVGWLATTHTLPLRSDIGENDPPSPLFHEPIHTFLRKPHLEMRPQLTKIHLDEGVPGFRSYFISCYSGQQSPHIFLRLFLGVGAYQLSRQALLRAKCIDWFLIAPELGGERKWGRAFVFLFSNLTPICNLSAIYIIPFRFMNYKEESIPLDKNTLKQLDAFILTF